MQPYFLLPYFYFIEFVSFVSDFMKFQNHFWLKTYKFAPAWSILASLRLSWCVGTIVVIFVAASRF